MAAKLQTEQETPEMEERIFNAFAVSDAAATLNLDVDSDPPHDGYGVVFEHGQWWINADNGAQWSVCDATGGDAIDGFTFEQISEAQP
jgi:hypothetical protein